MTILVIFVADDIVTSVDLNGPESIGIIDNDLSDVGGDYRDCIRISLISIFLLVNV